MKHGQWRLLFILSIVGSILFSFGPRATSASAPSSLRQTVATFAKITKLAATAGTAATASCVASDDLIGWMSSNTTGAIKNRSTSCSYKVGIASYRKVDATVNNQQIFDWKTTTIGPNRTIYLTVAVPNCAAQVDVFRGDVLLSLNGVRYGTRLLASRQLGGTNYCTNPTPTITPTKTPVPPTATKTPVPPTTTSVPPTATNTPTKTSR